MTEFGMHFRKRGLLFLAVTLIALRVFALEVECGFHGFVKNKKWFPVSVTPASGDIFFSVYVMQTDWCDKNPMPVSETIGTFPTTSSTKGVVLCRISQRYQKQFIRCRVTKADGTSTERDIKPNILSENDIFVLTVTDTPDVFDFLGSIQMPRRGIVRVFNCSSGNFPHRWQALDSVDVVVLDGFKASFGPEQRDALAGWVSMGGTVVLTDRSLLPGPEKGAWGLLPAGKIAADYKKMPSPELAAVLGKYGGYLEGIRSVRLQTPAANRIVGTEEATLVAAIDRGCGRVIALGFNWQEMNLKDRIFYEGTRQTLWSFLLGLRRPVLLQKVPEELVTPEEAKVKPLVKYIAIFLAAYVVILGPVNWLILRSKKKLEYTVLTIPAGAVVFSLIAFGVGFSLRSSDTILDEAEVLFAQNAKKTAVFGTAGILSPDRTPYRLHLGDAQGLIEFCERGFYGRDQAPRRQDMIVYDTEGAFDMDNVKIGTWSMRYFSTRAISDLGGWLTAIVTCGKDGLSGSVSSSLPFVLRGAFLIHRWNRISLGDLAPGVSIDFSLPLLPASREIFPKCSNCGRYHGKDISFTEKFCRKHPVPEGLREFMSSLSLNQVIPHAFIVGWQDIPETYVGTGRANVRSKGRRLCVIPIELYIEATHIIVPEGMVAPVVFSAKSWSPQALFVANIRYPEAVLPEGEAYKESCFHCFPAGFCMPEHLLDQNGDRSMIYDYYLPFTATKVETAKLFVHWDAGDPHPDEKPVECVLAAYDWLKREWTDLLRAQSGERTLDIDAPGRFVRLPYGMVRLKLAPVEEGSDKACRVNFLEIAYIGQRAE